MFWFIVMILFIIIAIVLFVLRKKAGKANQSPGDIKPGVFTGAAVFVLILAAVVFGLNFFTTVPSNSVAIETAFGKPVGTAAQGLHFLMPWENVTSFSTQVQKTDRLQDPQNGDQPGSDCVQINLKGGASACADITIRYQVNPQDVIALWQQYGTFDAVKNSLLRSATNNAAKIVYGKYSPQDAISGDASVDIANGITTELKSQLANSGLTLLAVAPGQLHLSDSVQNQINEILNAQTNATVAQQNLAVSQAQAQANQALTNSLSPQILAEDCFKAAEQIKPTVFNCDFSGSGSTNNTPVIVNGK